MKRLHTIKILLKIKLTGNGYIRQTDLGKRNITGNKDGHLPMNSIKNLRNKQY